MLATECGGEGRNFEFCHRLVLFDLPWSAAAVEQRIGRLDRIGRDKPVEIVYLRPPEGLGASIATLFETIGLFREPLGGLERELKSVERAIEEAALSDAETVPASFFEEAVRQARAGRDRVAAAAYRELYRDPFEAKDAEAILARVPPHIDELTEDVVLGACAQLGLRVEEHRHGAVHSILFGNHAKVDSLPGVQGGSSFLGTFDRAEAVADESIDYFASGHPLVEGLLAEIDDGPVGAHRDPPRGREGRKRLGAARPLPHRPGVRGASAWMSRASPARTGRSF